VHCVQLYRAVDMISLTCVCRHCHVHAKWPVCAQRKDLHVDDRCVLLTHSISNVHPLNGSDTAPPVQASCAFLQTFTPRAGSPPGVLEPS
jgi:DTW domain-containing protein YfiP